MKNPNLLDHADIVELASQDENKKLMIHWEGQDGHKETTPWTILDDIKDGDYTAEAFDEYAYCVTREEFEQLNEEAPE